MATTTIIATVRERYNLTEASLASLYEHTPEPFDLVYVDVCSPGPVRRALEREAEARGFTLIRVDDHVSPNRARNIGVEHATGDYLVFVDNDVIFWPGWLRALLDCADDTGAWAVGPLYLHGEVDKRIVHMAGGTMTFTGEEWGSRQFEQVQLFFNRPLAEVPPEQLVRQPSDIIEFHCALVRRDVFDKVGLLDEDLLTTREHLDFCLRIFDAGGSVWFEPSSVITYQVPPPFGLSDIAYFSLRWSDEWTRSTLTHFARKYGIDASYRERVAKTRKRRQALLFAPVLRPVRRVAGERAAKALGAALAAAEPAVNRVIVEAIGRRPRGIRQRVVTTGGR